MHETRHDTKSVLGSARYFRIERPWRFFHFFGNRLRTRHRRSRSQSLTLRFVRFNSFLSYFPPPIPSLSPLRRERVFVKVTQEEEQKYEKRAKHGKRCTRALAAREEGKAGFTIQRREGTRKFLVGL